jgi:hypothetical protein
MKYLALGVLFVAFAAQANVNRVYPRIGGVPVDQLCLNSQGNFNAVVTTCQDYSVTEAGPSCVGPTKTITTIPRTQSVCDTTSIGEDYPACVSSHLETASLVHTVSVVELGSYTVDEGGPSNDSRVIGYENFVIPNCQ